MQYTQKEYLKYVKSMEKRFGKKKGVAVSFEDWKKFQPAADRAVAIINKVFF